MVNRRNLTAAERHLYYAPLTEDLLFKKVFSNIPCLMFMINACPELRKRNLEVVKVEQEASLVPSPGKREYFPDILVDTNEKATGKQVMIDFEMQNFSEGSQQIRGEAYNAAIRCIATPKGSNWSDMPDTITVLFVNRIPVGEDLCYRVSSMHGVGLDGNGKEHIDNESHTMVIYVRMDLDTQEKVLKTHPELSDLAKLVHDLHENTGDGMIVDVIKDFVNGIKENPKVLRKYSEEFQKLLDEENKKAKAEGKAEGKIEEKADMIRRMAERNYPITEMINISGYTEEEVRKILDSYI